MEGAGEPMKLQTGEDGEKEERRERREYCQEKRRQKGKEKRDNHVRVCIVGSDDSRIAECGVETKDCRKNSEETEKNMKSCQKKDKGRNAEQSSIIIRS